MPASKLPGAAADLLSGVLATATLGATFFVLDLPVLVAAGVAVAVYGGTRLLLSAPAAAAADDDGFAVEVVRRGRGSLRDLLLVAARIEKPSVRASIDRICDSGQKIYSLFESDPNKLRVGRGFVEFTLGRTLKIVTRYAELSRSGVSVAVPTLERAEGLLATIDTSLREQIERLMREDVSDLDSEIDVLNARLEFEGDDSP